jgi:Sap, sulfolipid-1-addressing protein
MGWIDAELALVAVSAAVSPTTLTFSTLALVLGKRPLRTGAWFYLGAFVATLAVGIVAAFVLGNVAADPHPSQPKTWVAVVDIVAGALLLAWVIRLLRRPASPERVAAAVAQMSKVVDSRAVAVLGAGAMLANPGAFIPLALKAISELDPDAAEYAAGWLFFTLVALLPLSLALAGLLVAREPAERLLARVRGWLERRARNVAAVIVIALALVLVRNGIAGLVG